MKRQVKIISESPLRVNNSKSHKWNMKVRDKNYTRETLQINRQSASGLDPEVLHQPSMGDTHPTGSDVR